MLTNIFFVATFIVLGLNAYDSISRYYLGKPLYKTKAVSEFLDALTGIFIIGCMISFILERV